MAASSSSLVRVRLYFDYPPPCMPDCRMSWVLLDLNRCRVVTDLCSVIKERFNYSRRTEFDLFIQDCYLPPAESIHVVRDEDAIRVKVSSYEVRKRRREEDDDSLQGPAKKNKDGETQVNGLVSETKKKKPNKKKKKKRREEKQSEEALRPSEEASTSKSRLDQTKTASPSVCVNGKRGGTSGARENSSEDEPVKSKAAEKKSKPQTPPKPSTNSKVGKKSQKQSSSDSSSSSEEEENKTQAAKKSTLPITPIKTDSVPKKLTTSSKKKPETSSYSSSSSSSGEDSGKSSALKPAPKLITIPQTSKKPSLNQPSSDSSSSSDDDDDEPEPAVNLPKTQTRPSDLTPSTPVYRDPPQSPDSDSTDTELVIKKPNLQLTPGMTLRGRGRGFPDRARNRGGARGGFGRTRGTPWKRQGFHYNYENEEKMETQTNKSLVIQNLPEAVPKRDYVALPLLAAPPAVGTKIAFKLLELTESYTPEVSDYKEGKVVGFNPSTNMVELELLTHTQGRTEPGKFDLVYQEPDGSERVEYAVTLGSQLTERWESLLEPRLIVESMA